jgi:hypothetical protein
MAGAAAEQRRQMQRPGLRAACDVLGAETREIGVPSLLSSGECESAGGVELGTGLGWKAVALSGAQD